jgi:hypothetical protein
MAILPTDPNLLLLYGLDESTSRGNRANSGSLGSDHDLVVGDENDAQEGITTADDDLGGKAVKTHWSASAHNGGVGFTNRARFLLDKAAEGLTTGAPYVAQGMPPLPMASNDDDFTLGVRFRWTAPYGDENTTGLPEIQTIWHLGRNSSGKDMHDFTELWNAPMFGVSIIPEDIDPASDQGRLSVGSGLNGSGASLLTPGASWTEVGTAFGETYYLKQDVWYRFLCKYEWTSGQEYACRVYLYNESTGVLHVLQGNAGDFEEVYQPGPMAWSVGGNYSSAYDTFFGETDEAWLYSGPVSDADAADTIITGLSVQWSEPDRYREPHEVHSALTKENADYPLMRPLPTGGTIVRHPVDVLAQEIRTRLEGWKAGQPWALRAVDYVFDPAGPYGSQRARKGERPDLSIGVWRQPGQKPWGAAEDSRNIEYTYAGPRRRRGFEIRRDVDSTATLGHNAFWTWRSYADELFMAYKVGSAIYLENGSETPDLISSGWSASQIPVTFLLDDRFIILSPTTGILLDGTTTPQDFGVAAPASIVPAASAGGTLNDSYYYAATLYDPVHGDESGPVVSVIVSPALQKVTLTLPAASPDARFTQYRIYRTNAAGSVPNLFLIDTVTVAASYIDTGEEDGTMLLPQVTDSDGNFLDYITGSPLGRGAS